MSTANGFWQQVQQSDLYYYYRRDKVAIVSSLVFITLALMALFSPLIAPSFCSAPTTRAATCGARFSTACACRY